MATSFTMTLTKLFNRGFIATGNKSHQHIDVINSQTDENISRYTLLWLLMTNVAVLTPLIDKTTPWSLAICVICFLWRLGIYVGKVAKPPRWLVTSLALGAAIALTLVSKSMGLLNALINLLILGYALKYIEMRSVRDVHIVVLVGYFLIGLIFIEHQSLLNSLHLSLVILINSCVLLSLYQDKQSLRSTAIFGAKLLLQSVPLAVLLFIVLPRLSPLWLVPNTQNARTGLSDNIALGDITQLTRSTELAFRATFMDVTPGNAQLYWRALVLEDYDGNTWQQESGIKQRQRDAFLLPPSRQIPTLMLPKSARLTQTVKAPTTDTVTTASPSYFPEKMTYQVIAEPSHQHWLYSVDVGYSQDEKVVNMPDFRLYAVTQLDQRIAYHVSSWPYAIMDPVLSAAQRQLNLRLPPQKNPRTVALAAKFARQYAAPKARLNAMMNYFNQQPFVYTLTPPKLGPQQIDDFLFENKAGFCAHYAAAFIILARASGLPARMVTGYQGGEFNPQAGYFSVYQYMAHAWAEVWLEGEGWQRFDPTTMVAPDRIALGFDAQFDPQQSYLQQSPFSSLRLKTLPWLNELRLRFASIDYYWSQWVLGYDQTKQYQLMNQLLDGVTWEKMTLLMLLCLSVITLYIAYCAGLLRFTSSCDPLSHRYLQLCRQLAQKGFITPSHLSADNTNISSTHTTDISAVALPGPFTLAEHICQQHQKDEPALCLFITQLTCSYVALKYQPLPTKDALKQQKHFYRAANRLAWLLLWRRAIK